MKLTEKAAYIKGLADGLDLDKASKEGKLIAALIDMVEEMAATIATLDESVNELNDYIEEIDSDLGDVEQCLLDDEDDYGCDCDCDGDCECCDYADECDDAEFDDEDYFEIECPSCGEIICFDDSIDPEDMICPACQEKIAAIVEEEDLKKLDGEDEE